jgi:hypothetical protein
VFKRGLCPLFSLKGGGREKIIKGAGLQNTPKLANVYREKNHTEEKTD